METIINRLKSLLSQTEDKYQLASKATVQSIIDGNQKMNFYNSGAAAAYKDIINELRFLLEKEEN